MTGLTLSSERRARKLQKNSTSSVSESALFHVKNVDMMTHVHDLETLVEPKAKPVFQMWQFAQISKRAHPVLHPIVLKVKRSLYELEQGEEFCIEIWI